MRRALALATAALALACGDAPPELVYESVPVERRDIEVSAHAAGVVEPALTVEVKSKASGEILELAVDTGERVERGALMVRIDQRQPRNSLALAEAELEVARARLANAESQKRRAEELFEAQSIPETAYDQAVLDHANARAELVRASVAVENARIEMDDTEIRAPITGTIIQKNVERGQVISSPTRDVAGGTVLLQMADLSVVQVRAVVDETDIGKLRAGMPARVTVAAFPERLFEGEVIKIEPQSVTLQNVTMFPVLVSVENREGLLRPGMNCEVEIEVARREDALAIPNAALRTPAELGSASYLLGLSEDEVRRQLGLQIRERRAARGEGLPPEARAERARRARAARGGPGVGAGRPPDGWRPGSGPGPRLPGGTYVVFAVRDGAIAPVIVRTGVTDLDYIEVRRGLDESDAVFLLPSEGLVRSQQRTRERLRMMTGNGLPGMRSSE